MSAARDVLDRLRRMGVPLSASATMHHTYAGRQKLKAGAWSWFVLDPVFGEVCGSHRPLSVLAGQPGLAVVEGEFGTAEVVCADEVIAEDGAERTFVHCREVRVLFLEEVQARGTVAR
jgi:hypothetical protein